MAVLVGNSTHCVLGAVRDSSRFVRHMQEEHLWNYAPDGGDSCSGTTKPFSAADLPFVQSTNAPSAARTSR